MLAVPMNILCVVTLHASLYLLLTSTCVYFIYQNLEIVTIRVISAFTIVTQAGIISARTTASTVNSQGIRLIGVSLYSSLFPASWRTSDFLFPLLDIEDSNRVRSVSSERYRRLFRLQLSFLVLTSSVWIPASQFSDFLQISVLSI